MPCGPRQKDIQNNPFKIWIISSIFWNSLSFY